MSDTTSGNSAPADASSTPPVRSATRAPRTPSSPKGTGAKTPLKWAPRPRKSGPGPDLTDFRTWLSGLGMAATPTIHVNGLQHSGAIVVVDFGTPLKQVKLTTEQTSELVNRIRGLVHTLAAREIKVQVTSDVPNGVWWAGVT